MDDGEILQRINTLVDEEDRLHGAGADHTLEEADRARLREIEEGLDQCWDLLRQRRARRHAGEDPDAVTARSVDTVEHYQQ
jgi:hypothetical protein